MADAGAGGSIRGRSADAPAGGLERLRGWLARSRPRVRVRVIETHLSRVLLAGDRVYKLRRLSGGPGSPEIGLLDREAALRREFALNRRHSPRVYLGVQALGQGPGGAVELLEVGGSTQGFELIDWVLVMRRLPRARMLDQAIRAGTVAPDDIDRVAARLRVFHGEGVQVGANAGVNTDVDAGALADRVLARISREQQRNRRTLADAARHLGVGSEPARAIERVLLGSDARWAEVQASCRARAMQGLIVEGHGDLRPEHVCLHEPIELIDGLEFSKTLRLLDPWEELCLLGLMCGMAGSAWIGPRLASAYRAAPTGGHQAASAGTRGAAPTGIISLPPQSLLAFYTAHHALVRARLAYAHLLVPGCRRVMHWRAQTRRYLACAQAACEGWSALGGACAEPALPFPSAAAR